MKGHVSTSQLTITQAGRWTFWNALSAVWFFSIDLKIIQDRLHTARLTKQEIIRATLPDSKCDFYQHILDQQEIIVWVIQELEFPFPCEEERTAKGIMHELVSRHMPDPCGSRNPLRFLLVFVAKSKITQKNKGEHKTSWKYLDGVY